MSFRFVFLIDSLAVLPYIQVSEEKCCSCKKIFLRLGKSTIGLWVAPDPETLGQEYRKRKKDSVAATTPSE